MIPVLSTVDQFLQQMQTHPINWEEYPAPGKWSPKQIIGHLCDSAQINLQRFIRCTYEQNFKLIYHQEEWVALQRYQEMPVEDIIKLWQLLNGQIQRVLDDYPPDRWQVTCDNGRYEPSFNTVEFIARDYVAHMQNHFKQIIA
ncbi:DinB family protein [Mucilaginibacter myungsuensis]|uniref:DinB family protein n=1 Tax=Mucilaginibacter myungsuensis TaxID=649104 RepID=A0A929KWM3_9SPHI|nr:DinB family protein [Mucilaginibacter myungsuensis]MBE9660269.1 DinB family protein [Mucilaginibacter myungsuensis]MDN3600311.1 DinB family protein [Mucilaginibacter myungsuensis]